MAGSRGRPSLASPDAPPADALPQLYERTVPGGRWVAGARALRARGGGRLRWRRGVTRGLVADALRLSALRAQGRRLCWRHSVTRGCRADKRSASASGSGRRRAPSGAVALASLMERRYPRFGGGCAALIRPTRTGAVGFVGGVASLVVVGRISAAHAPARPKEAARPNAAAVVGRISAAHAPARPKEAARPNAADAEDTAPRGAMPIAR